MIGVDVPILPFIERERSISNYPEFITIPTYLINKLMKVCLCQVCTRHFLIPSIIVIAMAGIGCYFWNQLLLLFTIITIVIIGLFVIKGVFCYVKHAGFKMTKNKLLSRILSY